MENVLAVLMALGIYVVAPILVAIAVCGVTTYTARHRAEKAKSVKTQAAAEKAAGFAHHHAKT